MYLYIAFIVYIYIYITEDFETPTIFHVSIILKNKKIKNKNIINLSKTLDALPSLSRCATLSFTKTSSSSE